MCQGLLGDLIIVIIAISIKVSKEVVHGLTVGGSKTFGPFTRYYVFQKNIKFTEAYRFLTLVRALTICFHKIMHLAPFLTGIGYYELELRSQMMHIEIIYQVLKS